MTDRRTRPELTEAGPDRYRRLPERILSEDTFIAVPVRPADPGRDAFSHDEWLARNVWCGTLL
ncbi:hypothetical protein [Kitasatospora phosalacinea]|uniref:hypothetical protein n=1 Tax=Kitasatospora phosalacinea TaxID=2065 RepID=UPI000524523C|nr:hypothetical protein [Kitasatospora phosalacinea]